MEYLFKVTAMSLDTLPHSGRIILLAFFLSLAFSGLSRILPVRYGDNTHILYRKAALLALIAVPLLVWLTQVRMTVYVEPAESFDPTIARHATAVMMSAWFMGVIVSVYRLWQKFLATRADVPVNIAGEKLTKRLDHWRARLNIRRRPALMVEGAKAPWHCARTIILPAAAFNWPGGVVDAMLLTQLAQIKQRCWPWMMFAQGVGCLFWFAPWVKKLAAQLCVRLPRPALSLARAAYRDPPGWRRDCLQAQRRLQTMTSVGDEQDSLLRLACGLQVDLDELEQVWSSQAAGVAPPRSEKDRWTRVRHRYWQRHFDPYERVYWLVAGASLLVAFLTTLTAERAPPAFEPEFLEIKWQDQMQPRIDREAD